MLTKMFIEKYRRYPLVSFGQAKAVSLVEHFKEIEEFTRYVAPVQVPHTWSISEDDIPF